MGAGQSQKYWSYRDEQSFHRGQVNAMPLFSESSNFGAVDCITSLCVFYFKSAVWRFLS